MQGLGGPAHGQGSEVEPSGVAPAYGFTASAVDQRPLGQLPPDGERPGPGRAVVVDDQGAVKVRDRR